VKSPSTCPVMSAVPEALKPLSGINFRAVLTHRIPAGYMRSAAQRWCTPVPAVVYSELVDRCPALLRAAFA
jgi:hypothetical protein